MKRHVDDVEGGLQLAQALMAEGRTTDARIALAHLQHQHPANGHVRLTLAQAHLAAGDGPSALYEARQALLALPRDPRVLVCLAEAASQDPRHTDEARASARRAVEIEPAWAQGWAVLSRVELAAGRPYEAAVAAETGMELDPGAPDPVLALAAVAEAAGQWEEAADHYGRVLAALPDHHVARQGLDRSLGALGVVPSPPPSTSDVTGDHGGPPSGTKRQSPLPRLQSRWRGDGRSTRNHHLETPASSPGSAPMPGAPVPRTPSNAPAAVSEGDKNGSAPPVRADSVTAGRTAAEKAIAEKRWDVAEDELKRLLEEEPIDLADVERLRFVQERRLSRWQRRPYRP